MASELSLTERQTLVQAAVCDRLGVKDTESWLCNVRDLYDDRVAFSYEGQLYVANYSIGDDGSVQLEPHKRARISYEVIT